MSFFAYHYIETMLIEAGGPKRRGLFNSEAVYNSMLVDVAIKQMIEYAAALGACRPHTALQILTSVYKDRDWDGNNAPQIENFIENSKKEWDKNPDVSPNEIVHPIAFSKHGEHVAVKLLHDREIQAALEQFFVDTLLWGLLNQERFKSWYERDSKDKRAKMPLYNQVGLDINYIPTLSQYLEECEKMVKGYEDKMGKLSEIAPQLFKIANRLGIHID